MEPAAPGTPLPSDGSSPPTIPVISPEDLIASKILAGRSKDLDDVRGILRTRSDLDLELVRRTLTLLESALDRTDLLSALENLAR